MSENGQVFESSNSENIIVTSTTTTNINNNSGDEISPLKLKMENLATRSSFSSFFCKTKKVKTEPHRTPQSPVYTETITTINITNTINESKNKNEKSLDSTSPSSEHPSSQVISSSSEIDEQEPVITISDNENSDDFASKKPTDMDLECISISSTDNDECSIIAPRRSKRINTVCSTIHPKETSSALPLSDYSDMKRITFSKPYRPEVISAANIKTIPTSATTLNSIPTVIPTVLPSASSVPALVTISATSNSIHTTLPSVPAKVKLSTPITAIYIARPSAPPVPALPTTSTSYKSYRSASNIDPSYDPGLRAELMSRLSQKDTTKKQQETADAVSDRFVLFDVIQRLNVSALDPASTRSLPSFKIYWKTTENFGAMKRKLAVDLRVSPFDLVLTKVQDNSELYDTTRPSSLGIIGLSLNDFKSKYTEASKNNIPNFSVVSSQLVDTANTTTKSKNNKISTPPFNNALTTPLSCDSSNTYSLFLYTRKSFDYYNQIQQNNKKQVFDSVSFLQTADAEMKKLSPITEEELKKPVTPVAVPQIALKVKTATTKNQIFPVSVPADATVQDVLEAFMRVHPVSGTLRVIFDGDVLAPNTSIEGILEDDDMIEIK